MDVFRGISGKDSRAVESGREQRKQTTKKIQILDIIRSENKYESSGYALMERHMAI